MCIRDRVKADTTIDDFQTPEMKTIARRLDESVRKMKGTLLQHMSLIGNQKQVKEGLVTYDNFVMAMINAKPQCVAEGMATLSSNAYTAFTACLPDRATLNQRMQEGQRAITAVFDQLKTVDQAMVSVADQVMRAEMAAEADAKYAGEFYLKITNHIFSSMAPVQQCIEKAATALRDTLLKNINSMTTCYTS